jgi:Holliday junction resolvasome RuvABC endonuclease subunit
MTINPNPGLILCVDPGSVEWGWALLELDGSMCRYAAHGKCLSSAEAFDGVLRLYNPGFVALEVAEGYSFAPFRVPHLLATAEFVGVVTAVSKSHGVEVIRLTSSAVRKAILGRASVGGRGAKKGATDLAIKAAVEANVIGWPKRSSVHSRDAAAAGIVAAWMIAGRRKAG